MTAREPRHHLLLSHKIIEAVNEFRHANRIDTRTEAIERLIWAGLKAETNRRRPASRQPKGPAHE